MSPVTTREMLRKRYSAGQWKIWERANEAVRERQQAYDDGMIAGTIEPVYKFDHGVLHDEDVEVGPQQVSIGRQIVQLDTAAPYLDMKIS